MQTSSSLNNYREELKGKILVTAQQMFWKQGFKAVKMDDISKALGISKRTLYEIFPNKEDLIVEAVKSIFEQNQEKMNKLIEEGEEPVIEMITRFYDIHFNELADYNPQIFDDLCHFPKLYDYLQTLRKQRQEMKIRFLKKGQEDGTFLPDINYELAMHLSDLLNTAMAQNKLHSQYAARDIFKTTILMFVRSVCTQKGIEQLDICLAKHK